MGKALGNVDLLNCLPLESVNLFALLPGTVRSAIRNGVLASYADVTAAILDAHADNPGRGIILPDGAYRVSGTMDLTADNSFLEGAGQSTRIFQYTPDIDTFRLRPTTAGTTSAYLNSPALRNLFVSHTPVAAASTQGAAVRVTQCNAWRVTGVYTADADIFVEGGQAGFIDDIWGYAVNGSYRGTDSASLHFVQAAYGAGLYQPMFTTKVGTINLSGSGHRDTVVRIANADGLQFSTGYLNNSGGNSLVKIKAERDNSYVAALNLGSLYLDGVGGCLNGIDAPADGFANSFIYDLVLPPAMRISGVAQRGIKVRKDIWSFENQARIEASTLWSVDFEGDGSNSVLKFSPTTVNNGDATSGDIRIGGSGKSLSLVGWKSKSAETVALLLAAGTWGRGVIANCTNDANIADISNLATFTDGLDFNGNVSAFTGAAASSWRGLNQLASKATPVDADVLSVWDSAASWVRKSLTIANLKAAIWSGWGALINTGTSKATPVDADALAIMDSAASNATKKLTWANLKATLKTYLDTLYQPLASALTSWALVTRAAGFDTFAATPSSANLAALLTDETGTAGVVPFHSTGTFTPTLTFGGAAVGLTYTTQSGTYVRIGSVVFVRIVIVINAVGSSTGSVVVNSLPFTATGDNASLAMLLSAGAAGLGTSMLMADVNGSATTVRLSKLSGGTRVDLANTDVATGTRIQLNGHYTV